MGQDRTAGRRAAQELWHGAGREKPSEDSVRYEFKPSFDGSLRERDARQKEELKTACLAFIGLLEERAPMPGGIGLKRLRGDFWEVRRGLHNRVLFRWSQDLIEFVLAGDHDSIKDFLKNC